jgi:phosphatidate cytidylyltransferase
MLGADFRRRAITALIGAPLVLAMILAGLPTYVLLVIVTGLICVTELRKMIAPGSTLALITLASVMLACFASLLFNNYLILAAVLIIFLATHLAASSPAYSVRNYVYQALGGLYIGLPLSLLFIIRALDRGLMWTIMLFLNNWSTDSLALIGGRLFGKRKLAPRISPKKTIEGTLIGIVGGFIVGMIAALIGGLPVLPALIANIAIPLLTVSGDLLESWLKRRFAIKDSGAILPGHGGILDRIDGMLLAGPGLFLVLRLLG